MKAMYKTKKRTSTFTEQGVPDKPLPVGLLIEPVAFSNTDVVIRDLCNGVTFRISISAFEADFEPFN